MTTHREETKEIQCDCCENKCIIRKIKTNGGFYSTYRSSRWISDTGILTYNPTEGLIWLCEDCKKLIER